MWTSRSIAQVFGKNKPGLALTFLSSTGKGEIVQAQQAQNVVGSARLFNDGAFVQKAYRVRLEAGKQELQIGIPPHPTNGHEERYPNKADY